MIYISKKNYTLEVYDRKASLIACFRIAYGSNPDGKAKLHEGDNRTPEGVYFINEILSMDAGRGSDSRKKLRGMNRIYFRARDGHSKFGRPSVDLGYDAYGPRFFGLSYPNNEDKRRYLKAVREGKIRKMNGKMPGIGFGIAIHGCNDEDSIGHLSSSGCIRMHNRDIVECERYVRRGAPVIITAE